MGLGIQPVLAQGVSKREIGNQIIENLADADPADRELIQRYTNSRGASFSDFLGDGSILISTRFGQTNQLHQVKMPGGARQQLTFFDEPVAGARSVPGTSTILLSKDRGGDEWFQLYSQKLGPLGLTGTRISLTEDGTRNASAVLSRDGKTLLWSRSRKGSGDADVMIADPSRPETRRVLVPGDGALAARDIADDGTHALIGRSISIGESKLWLLDMTSGQRTEINPTAGRVAYEGGQFSADGKSILTVSNQGSDTRRLVRIDLGTGKMTALSTQSAWDVEDFAMSHDRSMIAYGVNEDGYSTLYLLDLRSSKPRRIDGLPKGVIGNFHFSADGKSLGVTLTTATAPSDVYVINTQTLKAVRWTQSELGDIDPESLVEPGLLRFSSFDGRVIPAFIYRPKSVSGKLPVVIEIHGGPEGQSRPGFNTRAQMRVAALGAAVILPNVRGSTGYGQTYLDLDNGDKREDSVKDIGALLDWIAAQPDLDPNRIIVYGGSYGGYMSLASMTFYSDRLLGGVELFGISNFISFLENTEAYRRDLRRVEYGDERDAAMRAVFERISPLANIARITKPMLVMQGWNDPRVPKSESDQVVAALRAKGLDVAYVQFKDEGHGFRKKINVDREREAELTFMKRLFAAKP
jgi:dipeptidyl aminopeptidase/acylaminoacyl peptidase